MPFGSATDDIDNIEHKLDQILEALGGLEREGLPAGIRQLEPGAWLIKETDHLENANADGTITLDPGDKVPLVEFASGQEFVVTQVGATDKADVQYGLRVDNTKIVGGMTNSPLGTLANPYSFIEEQSAVVAAEKKAEYVAHYSGDASGQISLASRMMVEVL